jgi:hypothetical protein
MLLRAHQAAGIDDAVLVDERQLAPAQVLAGKLRFRPLHLPQRRFQNRRTRVAQHLQVESVLPQPIDVTRIDPAAEGQLLEREILAAA